MTKEDILIKSQRDTDPYVGFAYTDPAIFKAMDEYAKQQAIAFADHLQFNYQPHPEAGFWHDHHSDQKGYVKLTSERLYNQFIEQQQKQTIDDTGTKSQ